jgi:hypothetical protein
VICEGAKLRVIKKALGNILDELEYDEYEREKLMSMLEKDQEEAI